MSDENNTLKLTIHKYKNVLTSLKSKYNIIKKSNNNLKYSNILDLQNENEDIKNLLCTNNDDINKLQIKLTKYKSFFRNIYEIEKKNKIKNNCYIF